MHGEDRQLLPELRLIMSAVDETAPFFSEKRDIKLISEIISEFNIHFEGSFSNA